ncbi:MAG: NADP-specific glutamate dehydrogenase, partial [Ruminococcus sp.]|nr:NADP-specific glutamate dehydrogenase [Ruminococcus sp.]
NGGLAGRDEATGYGIVFYAREMLNHFGESLEGKKVVISGFGNVAWGTAKKLEQLGAKAITISGPDGYILDEDGVTGEKIDYLLELRSSGKNICAPYADKFPGAKFFAGEKPWGVKADLYIPCATQNEIGMEEAQKMVANGCKFLCEAANMPTRNEAIEYFKENGVVVGPSKAANAGGVACSCIEMSQNAEHTIFTEDDVFEKLEAIMVNIFKQSVAACEKYNLGDDLIAGANIAGFERVANAMLMQGIV